jgi:FkbM family methyltransferase
LRAELRERLRLGRSGPLSRSVARAITRVAPVRRVDWIAYAVIGRPRGVRQRAVARRYGARFDLDLADDVDRLVFLDTYERLALRDCLALISPGDVVVDVGANIGLYSLAAAARGASVHAFEPVPSTADRFERNLELNPGFDVTLRRCAVSGVSGSLALFSESFDRYSGHASAHAPDAEGSYSVTVPAVTLDAALADLDDPIRLVKVDVEGHEAAVLRGAGQVFDRLEPRYLLLEVEDQHLRAGGSSASAVLGHATELGYRALGGYTLHHGLWPMTKPETVDIPPSFGIARSVLFERR